MQTPSNVNEKFFVKVMEHDAEAQNSTLSFAVLKVGENTWFPKSKFLFGLILPRISKKFIL